MKDETERAFETFFEAARRDLFPKLQRSQIVMSIVSGTVDAKLALELGAALLLDKPILIMIKKGTEVSPRLKLAVDEWVEYEGEPMSDPMFQARLAKAVRRLMEKTK